LKAFGVNLKACLGWVLLNQYCPINVWENWSWFLGDFTSWATPTSWSSLLWTTIVVHDNCNRWYKQITQYPVSPLIVQNSGGHKLYVILVSSDKTVLQVLVHTPQHCPFEIDLSRRALRHEHFIVEQPAVLQEHLMTLVRPHLSQSLAVSFQPQSVAGYSMFAKTWC